MSTHPGSPQRHSPGPASGANPDPGPGPGSGPGTCSPAATVTSDPGPGAKAGSGPALRLILGDQLNPRHSWFDGTSPAVVHVLMEIRQETDYVVHHAQKVLAIFAAMREFASQLKAAGHARDRTAPVIGGEHGFAGGSLVQVQGFSCPVVVN